MLQAVHEEGTISNVEKQNDVYEFLSAYNNQWRAKDEPALEEASSNPSAHQEEGNENHGFPGRIYFDYQKFQGLPMDTYQSMDLASANMWCSRVPSFGVGPYDVIELLVTSMHDIPTQREAARILGVAAGESLHNIYRVVMTSLNQREDRARLVFHAWVLPTGQLCGNGPRYRDSCRSMMNDRDVYLNELPLAIGYSLDLVFGKCVYRVTVEDILAGLTDEQDLIWTPRVCEGSYGEAVPFDLCYSPALFHLSKTTKDAISKTTVKVEPIEEQENDNIGTAMTSATLLLLQQSDSTLRHLAHLRPQHHDNLYLSSDELDDINKNLSKMRFIRQNSQIKPLLRKNRAEDYIRDESKRKRWLRLTPRKFFFLLWSQQAIQSVTNLNPVPPLPPGSHTNEYSSQCSTTTSSPNDSNELDAQQAVINGTAGLGETLPDTSQESYGTSHASQRATDQAPVTHTENLTLLTTTSRVGHRIESSSTNTVTSEKLAIPPAYSQPALNAAKPGHLERPGVFNLEYFSQYDPISRLSLPQLIPLLAMQVNEGPHYPRCRVSKRENVLDCSSGEDSEASKISYKESEQGRLCDHPGMQSRVDHLHEVSKAELSKRNGTFYGTSCHITKKLTSPHSDRSTPNLLAQSATSSIDQLPLESPGDRQDDSQILNLNTPNNYTDVAQTQCV